MIFTVPIQSADSDSLQLASDWKLARQIVNTGACEVEIRVIDPRNVSDEQRNHAWALYRAISAWSYHPAEYIHEVMKWDFCTESDLDEFSLGDTSMTIARLYINYLIEFCVKNGVPTPQPLYTFTSDIEAMIYAMLANRKCAVHNTPGAEIHHCTGSRVGMGRDRQTITHEGLVCLPLCRECHDICHLSEVDFLAKHHLAGLPLDKWLCQKLGMNMIAD